MLDRRSSFALHGALLCVTALVACDAVLGLDADYRVASDGGSGPGGEAGVGGSADGGGNQGGGAAEGGTGGDGGAVTGGGGAGGDGGQDPCATCDVCRSCDTGACVAAAFDSPDTDCDAGSCDGLGTCLLVDVAATNDREVVHAVATGGNYIAIAGAVDAPVTLLSQSLDSPTGSGDLYVALYQLDGTPVRVTTGSYGGTELENAIVDLAVTPAGDVLITGQLSANASITIDGETDNAGAQGGSYIAVWGETSTTLRAHDNAKMTNVAFDGTSMIVVGEFSNGNLSICGDSLTNSMAGTHDAFAIAVSLDQLNNCSWSFSWGTTNEDQVRALVVDPAGFVIVGGAFEKPVTQDLIIDNHMLQIVSGANGGEDTYVARLWPHATPPSQGFEWAVAFAGESSTDDIFQDLAVSATGDVYVAGLFDGPDVTHSGAVIASGSNGCNAMVARLDGSNGSSINAEAFAAESCVDQNLELAPTASGVALGGILNGTLDVQGALGVSGTFAAFAADLDVNLLRGWTREHQMVPSGNTHRTLAVGAANSAEWLYLVFDSGGSVVLDTFTNVYTTDVQDIFFLGYQAPLVPRP